MERGRWELSELPNLQMAWKTRDKWRGRERDDGAERGAWWWGWWDKEMVTFSSTVLSHRCNAEMRELRVRCFNLHCKCIVKSVMMGQSEGAWQWGWWDEEMVTFSSTVLSHRCDVEMRETRARLFNSVLCWGEMEGWCILFLQLSYSKVYKGCGNMCNPRFQAHTHKEIKS